MCDSYNVKTPIAPKNKIHDVKGLTWRVIRNRKMSLSFSNNPRLVYKNTANVILSNRLNTRAGNSSAGSAFIKASLNTTL